ncbi:MAG: F0F1 ATP synthase subunit epsilon [Candidatus Azobacteroides sp.]|nr:F0F1 ATP synthase subunit epsilon [Candidatus Azobacteroides sp.]
MKLDIVSPEKTLYSGEADWVVLPGMKGIFTILERHAPIISGLGKGVVKYGGEGKDTSLKIDGGFVEAKQNIVTVCVEQE